MMGPDEARERGLGLFRAGIFVGLFYLAVGAVVLVLVTTSCTKTEVVRVTGPTATQVAPPSTPSTPSSAAAYVRANAPTYGWVFRADTTDADIDELGAGWCSILSSATSEAELRAIVQRTSNELGLSFSNAAGLLGVFVEAYCPDATINDVGGGSFDY